LTKKIIDDGHEIGNHSFSHPHLTQFEENNTHNLLDGINREFIQKELLKTDSVFYSNFGQRMSKYWRAPFGEYNKKILQWAAEIGFKHIRWSKGGDLADWVKDTTSTLYKTNQQMYQQILEMKEKNQLNGSIILMHFGTDRKFERPFKMLPNLFEKLKKENFQILKISELLKAQIPT
jgi:peptidoglycan/xylan/chitin deacetylase (PgdA/CDA1 family)